MDLLSMKASLGMSVQKWPEEVLWSTGQGSTLLMDFDDWLFTCCIKANCQSTVTIELRMWPMLIFLFFFEKKEFAWCWCLESRFFPSQSSASDNVFSHLSATVVLSRKEFEFWEIFLTFKIQNLITFQNLNAANFTLRFPFARSSWRKVEVDWIMAIGPYNLHPLHPWASCHFGIHCQNYGICYSISQSLSQRPSS